MHQTLLGGYVALIIAGEGFKGRGQISREEVREMVGEVKKIMEEKVGDLDEKMGFSFVDGADKDIKEAFSKISKRWYASIM